MTTKNSLTATQTGPLQSGYRFFNFYGRYSISDYGMMTKVYADGTGYDSIEEILDLVPIARSNDVNYLKNLIKIDFGKGFPDDFPEYNCVAWAGFNETQKPIISYTTFDDKIKYLAHPQINLMVQRYTK